jgi:hypothetical protein
MTDEEMQILITTARRVAGYRGPGHAYWGMFFDAEALLRGDRSLLSREIIETMLIMTVGTAAARQGNLGMTEAILRPPAPVA